MVTGSAKTAGAAREYFKDRKENYFRGAHGIWQGKLSEEKAICEKSFDYNDFLEVLEKNDRFRTFNVKFTISELVNNAIRGDATVRDMIKGMISGLLSQIEDEMAIKFKREKYIKDKYEIVFSENKAGELIAKVKSHNVSKKNLADIDERLSDEKYPEIFKKGLEEKLGMIGILSSAKDYSMKTYAGKGFVGLDLVMSVPKSVSLTMMFPEHNENILKCMDEANRVALDYIEKNLIVSRIQVDGVKQRVLTGNLMAAKFTDLYNRRLQPQLHIHNFIFNTTRNPFYRSDEKSKEFLTIDFKAIKDNFENIDRVFKEELARGLGKVGYKLESKGKDPFNFEISGYSREQILHFSRTEIDEKLGDLGSGRDSAGPHLRNAANLMTRPEKVMVDFEKWSAVVLKEMRKAGVCEPELSMTKEMTQDDIDLYLVSAVNDYLYENAVFGKEELISVVLKKDGDVLCREYLENYFDSSGRFIMLGEKDGRSYFSTSENIKIEDQIYSFLEEGKNQRQAVVDESHVLKHLSKSTLNPDQKKALDFISRCKDQFFCIQGAPGSGKSYLLKEAGELLGKEGYRVLGLAPSNKAVLNLKKKSGFYASTLHAFYIRLQKEAGTWNDDRNPIDLRLTDFSGLKPALKKEIWFVDEASLIDNQVMVRLLEAGKLRDAVVVLLGDRNQLQPVGAGKPFLNMIEKNLASFVEVKEILRQKEVWRVYCGAGLKEKARSRIEIKAAKKGAFAVFVDGRPPDSISKEKLESLKVWGGKEVAFLRDSSVKDAVKLASQNRILESLNVLDGKIFEIRENGERIFAISRTYCELSAKDREQTTILTGTNRDRLKINNQVRTLLKEKKVLGIEETLEIADNRGRMQARNFSAGDRIVFFKKGIISGQMVLKDDVGTINKIETRVNSRPNSKFPRLDQERETILNVAVGGKDILMNFGSYNHFDHAYCKTSYKEQASGYKRVIANFDTTQHNVNSKNDYLVKLSRSKGELVIFTDDKKSLYDSVKKEQLKMSIRDFAECDFRVYQNPVLDGPGELMGKMTEVFEYRHAVFLYKDYLKGIKDINKDMMERGETVLEILEKDIALDFNAKFVGGYYKEIGERSGGIYFSTSENMAIEEQIYDFVQTSKNQKEDFSKDQVREFLKQTSLNKEQREALYFITGSKDRVIGIQGAPGVGKSFMLNSVSNFYEEQGYKVVALAPSNKAVINLKEKAGFESASTIHAYLIRLQREAGTWEVGRDPLNLRHTNLEGLKPGSHKEIWFVDEASLIDNYAMNRLLLASDKKKAEVVLIGDRNQLLPVGSGRPFCKVLEDRKVDFVEVNQILRQKEQWKVYGKDLLTVAEKKEIVREAKLPCNNAAVSFVKGDLEKSEDNGRVEKDIAASGRHIEIFKDNSLKGAVEDAVLGRIATSLNKLGSRILEIEDKGARFYKIAQGFGALDTGERNDTVIITATNKDRIALNDMVRDILKSKGDLGKGKDFSVTDILGKKQVREFSAGDKVIFLKKQVIDELFIRKDDVGIIKKVDGREIVIQVNGKDIKIDSEKYNHLDHAYARTTYRVQGADYNRVYCNLDTRQKSINSRNDYLVKISRSKHYLEIFTDDKEYLYDAVKNSQYKPCVYDFLENSGEVGKDFSMQKTGNGVGDFLSPEELGSYLENAPGVNVKDNMETGRGGFGIELE